MTAPAPEGLRGAIAAFRPELLRRARRLAAGRRDAEDLVHDTVVRALTYEGGYQDQGQARAWLHRILFSIFIESTKKARCHRRACDELREVEGSWTHGDPPPPMRALSPGVARALNELPEQFRALVVLIDLGERSMPQVSAELGIPMGTVSSRLHRGRRMLAERLAEARDAA